MKYSIRRLSSFDKLFTRLARKAVRLGLPSPSYTVTGERRETAKVYEISEGETRYSHDEDVVVHDIEISGLEPVVLPGWNFVASVETVKGAENMLYPAPAWLDRVPVEFRSTGCRCDHCNVRRDRVKTYVVHNGSEFKQVGSTCLQDFLGANSPERVADLFAFYGEIVHDLDALYAAERAGWEGGNAAHDLLYTAAKSIEVQKVHGWLSKSKAYEQGGTSTAERVRCSGRGDYSPDEDSLAKAGEAIAYFAALPKEENEPELTYKLRLLACAGYCSDKSFGLACALWACYKVAKDKEARELAKQRQRETSQHLWTVGQRVKGIEATVLRVYGYDTEWGYQVKTILEDAAGNVLVAKDLGHEEGQRVRFTATVKDHSEYDGVKQTNLLRAAKIETL